jgi:hypothetical protein
LALVAAFVCVAALLSTPTSRAAAPRRVLFIGNSLIAANDLPRSSSTPERLRLLQDAATDVTVPSKNP